VVCCYLLELLGQDDIRLTLSEIARVLRPGGRFSLVVIGQNATMFNLAYKLCASMVPAFWGRQVERLVPGLIGKTGLKIITDDLVHQSGYPSRVLIAQKSEP
jgi:ubiquinone/menaquinone biosynthesis C-methylase UbiE